MDILEIDLFQVVRSTPSERLVIIREATVGIVRDFILDNNGLKFKLRVQSKRKAPWLRRYESKQSEQAHRSFRGRIRKKNKFTVKGGTY